MSFVQAATGTISNNATLAVAYTSNNALGNFLVAAVRFNNAANPVAYTLVDSRGNTWTKAPSGFLNHADSQIDLWYSLNCAAGANTVTIHCTNPNNPNPEMVILEYSDRVTALDTSHSAQSSSNGTTPNSGNITTSLAAVELLIGLCCNETAGGLTDTPGGGFTARATPDGDLFVCDLYTTATGTFAFSSTLSSSVAWGAYVAAFMISTATASAQPVVCVMQ